MTDGVESFVGQYFSTRRRDDGRVLYNARMRKIARAAQSLTGILVIATLAITGASWLANDLAIISLAGYVSFFAGLIVLALWPPPIAWPPQWSLRRMFLVVACVTVILGTLTSQAPLRPRFALSRAPLERLADCVERGEPANLPQRCGLFVVGMADKFDDRRHVCLWTDEDSVGYSGFVRRSTAGGPLYERNLWWNVKLDDRWQFVIED